MAPNLADPAVEPTDEELQSLAARANAASKPQREAAMARLAEEIAGRRRDAIAHAAALRARLPR